MIELHGTRSLDDVRRAEYFRWFSGLRWWREGPVLAFFALIFTVATIGYQQGDRQNLINVIPFVILFLLFIGTNVVAPLWNARNRFAAEKWLGEPTTFTFSLEGIGTASPSSSSKIKWNIIREVRETRSLFLLYTGEDSAIMLPKRFFAGSGEMEAWRELVRAQLSCKPVRPRGLAARWC